MMNESLNQTANFPRQDLDDAVYYETKRKFKLISTYLIHQFNVSPITKKELFEFDDTLNLMWCAFDIAYRENLDRGLNHINCAGLIIAKYIVDKENHLSEDDYKKLVDTFFDLDELVKMVALQKDQRATRLH